MRGTTSSAEPPSVFRKGLSRGTGAPGLMRSNWSWLPAILAAGMLGGACAVPAGFAWQAVMGEPAVPTAVVEPPGEEETGYPAAAAETRGPDSDPGAAWTDAPEYPRAEARVVEVIDGDTIRVVLDGVEYPVRYIGIDTPETRHPDVGVEPFGLEAAEANSQLLAGGVVYLEKDVSEVDCYDRLLRYVYLPDGRMVNAELVRLGFAQASTWPPDVRHQGLFLELQAEARAAGRGLWGE
jgi:micrococcal nuclease